MKIKNWRKYQHYKHRAPPWIKLHRELLNDPEWFALDGDASKALAMCWLVAAEHNGALPELNKLAFRLRMPPDFLAQQIHKLSHWIEGIASIPLAPCKQDASKLLPQSTETETETERELNKEDTANAVSPSTKYAFESGVIRLGEKDLAKWKRAFVHLDLEAELLGLTDWAGEQGSKWFFAVSGALAKRNRQVKANKEGNGAQTDRERRKSDSERALNHLRERVRSAAGGNVGNSVVRLLPQSGAIGQSRDIPDGSD